MNNISGRLLKLRKSLGLNQELFALKLSMKRQTYANVEVGRIDVSIDLLKLLVTIYGVNYLWLLDGVGEMYGNGNKKEYQENTTTTIFKDDGLKLKTSEIDRLTNAINNLRDAIDNLNKPKP